MDKTVNVVIKGQDKISKQLGLIKNKFAGVAKAATSLRGILIQLGGLYVFKKTIDAAIKQETALAKLASSFAAVGGITEKAQSELVKYAEALQKVTTYGDDEIINAMAMLGTFALTGKQVKQLTDVVLDMSAATQDITGAQQSLQQVAIAVGKAVTGQAGILSRYGVTLTDAERKSLQLAKGQEKVDLVVQILKNNYEGTAKAIGQTFGGALAQAKNAAGDFAESLGNLIIKSKASIVGLEGMQSIFELLSKTIEDNAVSIRAAIGSILITATKLIEIVSTALSGLGDAIDFIEYGVEKGKKATDGLLDSIINLFPGMDGAATALTELTEAADNSATSEQKLASRLAEREERLNSLLSRLGLYEEKVAASVTQVNQLAQIKHKLNTATEESSKLVTKEGNALKAENINLDAHVKLWEKAKQAEQRYFELTATDEEKIRAAIEAQVEQYRVYAEERLITEQQAVEAQLLLYDRLDQKLAEIKQKQLEAAYAVRQKWMGALVSVADVIHNTLQAAVDNIASTIADGLVDGTWDWEKASKAILKTFIQMIAKLTIMASLYALTGGAGFLGVGLAGLMHSGGRIRKAHSGLFVKPLNPDEVPIVAQTGEYVMPRKTVESIGVGAFDYMRQTGRLPQTPQTAQAATTNLNMTFSITTLDSSDFEEVVRRKVIPAITAEIERGAVTWQM